jgi:hypothetical protein
MVGPDHDSARSGLGAPTGAPGAPVLSAALPDRSAIFIAGVAGAMSMSAGMTARVR